MNTSHNGQPEEASLAIDEGMKAPDFSSGISP
jgi:hypothetical protein